MLHALAEYNNMTHARYDLLTLPISAVTLTYSKVCIICMRMWTIRDGLTKDFTETVCCELFLWRKQSMPVDRLIKGVLRIDSQERGTAGTKFRCPSYRVVHQESVDCTIFLTWLKGIQLRVSSCILIGIIYPSFLFFFIFIYYLSVYSFT